MVAFNEDKFAVDRAQMVQHDLMRRDITDPAVLEVFGEIPRDKFVPQQYQGQAYSDQPLPIGVGQTISQPYIVALMTQHLQLNKDCEVLEIGTGSGYQTAILAKLAKKIYTIERHNQLCETAQSHLVGLGIENVEYYIGDGSCGWCEKRQFDRIIITAAVPKIPAPLIDQLKDGGIVIAPVGDEFSQQLIAYDKKGDILTGRILCQCRFVKLIGDYGFGDRE